jgi:hypothetical protein
MLKIQKYLERSLNSTDGWSVVDSNILSSNSQTTEYTIFSFSQILFIIIELKAQNGTVQIRNIPNAQAE